MTYEAPESQEALDKIINAAVARTHKQYDGFDDYKAKAEQFDALPQGLDVDAVEQAREEGRAEVRSVLAQERVNTAFDSALKSRALSANALLNFDKSAFVKDNAADVDAITAWVEANSSEIKTTTEVVPDSGRRSERSGGSVDSGRELYQDRHKKK